MSLLAVPSLPQIFASPSEFVGELDIGALNLICASDLPGAENLDVARRFD